MGLCGGKSGSHAYRSEDGEEKASASSSSATPPKGHASTTGGSPRPSGRTADGALEYDVGWQGDAGSGHRPTILCLAANEISLRRMLLIHDTWGDIGAFYSLESTRLGQGAFGHVCVGRSIETGATRAIKSLSKARAKDTRKRYRQEILIMKMTDHPNIIKLFETFEDKSHVFLVMEICMGGDLFHHLQSCSGRLKEKDTAVVMQQILRPVYYMHEKRLAHRDIKPENFLFLSKDPVEKNTLKLIDFGFSCRVQEGKMMTTKLGTPTYSSPQVFHGQYDESCDLWSCGVIMFVLLSGSPPFQGKTDAEVMQNVKRGNYAFSGPAWERVSDTAKDMIRKMLKYQPQDRWNAAQALRHGYIREQAPKQAGGMGAMLTPSLLMDLRSFCNQSLLRRAALQVVAQQLSQEETDDLRSAFEALDRKGSGILSIAELKEVVENPGDEMAGIKSEMVQVVTELSPEEDNAEISFTEFLAATLEAKHYTKEGSCRAAFRAFDRNADGRITQQELEEVLLGPQGTRVTKDGQLGGADGAPNGCRSEEIAALLRAADSNGDGVIDFEEFKNMLQGERISAV